MSTTTAHTATIITKAATGNGDLDGFAVTCTCGDVSTWSLPTLAASHKASHEAWHARQSATPARDRQPKRTPARKTDTRAAEARALAMKIRKGIPLYRRSTVLPNGPWRVIAFVAEAQERRDWFGWPQSVDTAIQGIGYALNTGRVGGSAALAIREMSDWDKCELVAEVALSCRVIGEVPAYLNQRFAA